MLGSPFFLIKTRLQSYSPFLPVGTQHKYANALDGMRQIYSAEGIKGLYRGVGPAMVRTGFGSSVQLPTYFFAKRRLQQHMGMKEGPALHLLSSTCSGFVVCCVMHPPDTVMSRMYNQTGNLYSGAFDCLYRTVKAEGILAVYKGFFAHLARILPHTVRSFPLATGGISLTELSRSSPSVWLSRPTSLCEDSKTVYCPEMSRYELHLRTGNNIIRHTEHDTRACSGLEAIKNHHTRNWLAQGCKSKKHCIAAFREEEPVRCGHHIP